MIKNRLFGYLLGNEIVPLLFLIIIFIGIRTINFANFLNFSHDQGSFSLRALEIYRNKTFTLIGPSTSLKVIGREVFQGSLVYYFLLIFLLLGNFNPFWSSYLFMFFCALTMIPLYFGVKFLLNKKAAFFVVIIYTALPYYINYTRFLWSPTFQLSLLPLLIYSMGLYKKNKKSIYLFMVSFWSGLLVLFHYEFILVFIGLSIYYVFIKLNSLKSRGVFILGFILGFSPIIYFELRHNFYNLRTILLFINNFSKIGDQNFLLNPHYYLTLSIFILIIAANFIKKYLSYKLNILVLSALLMLSIVLYYRKPSNGFGMANDWNYLDEKKVYEIIKTDNRTGYNIANLVYDTLASAQKFLQEKDNHRIDYYNYNTRYLYVISPNFNFLKNGPYEVSTFNPSRIISIWNINDKYNLYLLQKM